MHIIWSSSIPLVSIELKSFDYSWSIAAGLNLHRLQAAKFRGRKGSLSDPFFWSVLFSFRFDLPRNSRLLANIASGNNFANEGCLINKFKGPCFLPNLPLTLPDGALNVTLFFLVQVCSTPNSVGESWNVAASFVSWIIQSRDLRRHLQIFIFSFTVDEEKGKRSIFSSFLYSLISCILFFQFSCSSLVCLVTG